VGVAVLALATAASPARAESGLVGQWHLDEGSGTIVHDSSGDRNNGFLASGARWTTGRFGSALSFDGSRGQVHVIDNTSLEPASAVTVSAWIKSAQSPGDFKYIVAKGATGCIAASYGLYSGPSGGLEFYISKDRGTTYVRSPDAGNRVWDGNWHMVVGTFDGSKVHLYVDGGEIGAGTARSGSLEYVLPDSNDLFIGDYPGCALHTFDGAIDEISVWSRTVTASEVQATFREDSDVPPTSAVAPPGFSVGGSARPGASSGPGGSSVAGKKPPALSRFTIAPSTFAPSASRSSRHRKLPTAAYVSYGDTMAARTAFVVMQGQSGVTVRGRCSKPTSRTRGMHVRRCTRWVRIGTFNRTGRAGRNRFRFAGLPHHHSAPGGYRLDATPRANGLTGRTASARFTILR
jgi:Concanavalin A-like lectin/glucanases superfamily